MISPTGDWIFVHIQKTGGNAIRTALGVTINEEHKHRSAAELRDIYGREAWERAGLRFAFVRNPWDRLASWWSMIDRVIKGGGTAIRFQRFVAERASTFEEFLLNCDVDFPDEDGQKWIFRNQIDYLTDAQGNRLVEFIGRFENLESDFRRVAEMIGRPGLSLPRANAFPHEHYATFYTPKTAALVAERYGKDIETFGYRFSESPASSLAGRKSSFFDEYPRFLGTSTVGNWPARLNARHEAIVAAHAPFFPGARVLDIASHDGRWSYAALAAGAKYVVGVEPRPELVAASEANMRALGVSRDRYRFETADVFERPDIFREGFDLVLCLGFLYHTARHAELLRLIRETKAPTVIVDTALLPKPGILSAMRLDVVAHPSAGYSATEVHGGKMLVSVPTAGAVTFMLRHYGYSVVQTDWEALIKRLGEEPDQTKPRGPDNPILDYAKGERGTFLARLRG